MLKLTHAMWADLHCATTVGRPGPSRACAPTPTVTAKAPALRNPNYTAIADELQVWRWLACWTFALKGLFIFIYKSIVVARYSFAYFLVLWMIVEHAFFVFWIFRLFEIFVNTIYWMLSPSLNVLHWIDFFACPEAPQKKDFKKMPQGPLFELSLH